MQLVQSPLYQSVRREHQAALLAFVDQAPRPTCEAALSEPSILDEQVSPRLAARLTQQQLLGVTAFMRSPEGQEAWRDLATDVVTTPGNHPFFPDWSGTEAGQRFLQSDAGQALSRNADEIGVIFGDEEPRVLALIRPRLEAAMREGLCNALADECPAGLRSTN
jgi:hypothetical protein